MQRYWDSEPRVRPDASEAMQILLTLSVLVRSVNHTFVHLISRPQRTPSLEAID